MTTHLTTLLLTLALASPAAARFTPATLTAYDLRGVWTLKAARATEIVRWETRVTDGELTGVVGTMKKGGEVLAVSGPGFATISFVFLGPDTPKWCTRLDALEQNRAGTRLRGVARIMAPDCQSPYVTDRGIVVDNTLPFRAYRGGRWKEPKP